MALRYSYNPKTGEWGLDPMGKYRTPQELAYDLNLGHIRKGAQTNKLMYEKDSMGNFHFNQSGQYTKDHSKEYIRPFKLTNQQLRKYGFK